MGYSLITQKQRNGVKISFPFQANYFGVSQLSFEANSSVIERKDGTDDGKRMASNGEVILTPFHTTISTGFASSIICSS